MKGWAVQHFYHQNYCEYCCYVAFLALSDIHSPLHAPRHHQQYVRVFALDFSKAFGTVRHATLIDKMAKMQIPDQIFNWIKNFFDGHTHCTKYKSEISYQR